MPRATSLPLMVFSMLLLPARALAEREPTTLAPVVVTASMLPISPASLPASRTIISHEEIERQQATTLAELLSSIPGLHIDQQNGSASSVYLRGAEPNYTLVLLDGITVNDPTNSRGGSFDFSTLPADSVERIEVIRGAASSLYGSAAMGGVIQIFTRPLRRDTHVDARASAGSRSYFSESAALTARASESTWKLSGWNLDSGEQQVETGLRSRGATIHGVQTFGEQTEVSGVAHLRSIEKHYWPDDSGGAALSAIDERERASLDELDAALRVKHEVSKIWDTEIFVPFVFRSENFISPGVAAGLRDPFGIPANQNDGTYDRIEAKLLNHFQFGEELQLSVGSSFEREEARSSGSLDFPGMTIPTDFQLLRNLGALFFEVQSNPFEGLFIQSGLRYDLPENFGSRLSPSVGLSYEIASLQNTVFARSAKGFKLPSIYSLGHPVVGNQELLPETGKTFEAGFRQALARKSIALEASLFSNRFENAIDFSEGPPPQLVNRSSIASRGAELSVEYHLDENLIAKCYGNYLIASIIGSDEMLRYRPRWKAGASLATTLSEVLQPSIQATFVDSVHDSAIPTGDQDLGSYLRVDVRLQWKLQQHLSIFSAVNNLFDRTYYETVGNRAAGISMRAGISARF